ncbi:MAG: hypothetical protein JWO36_5141 [Myxococcales bacterium]|nr:hypothetical protein [Myxococcales bacterium]
MRPRNAILLAAVLVFVVSSWVPFGSTALYPLSLFTTWVHEMGHGLTALILGGQFDHLMIFRDGSGLAYCGAAPGWPMALVSLGGLLAPPILGTVILGVVHGPRRARIFLALLAAALVVSMLIFVRSPAGLISMPLVAALLAWAAWRGFAEKPERRVILAQVLGVMLAVDTLTRMVSYVFEKKVTVDGVESTSDIGSVAENLGGHYYLWGMLVTAIAVGLLALGMWWAWGRPAKQLAPAKR